MEKLIFILVVIIVFLKSMKILIRRNKEIYGNFKLFYILYSYYLHSYYIYYFINELNKFHPNLSFTYETSKEGGKRLRFKCNLKE